jgi:hypothetical protein
VAESPRCSDQGEANANEPATYYGCQLEAMIEEWRSEKAFNNSALPFFLVQLAPYYEPPCITGHKQPCGIGTDFPCVRVAPYLCAQTVASIRMSFRRHTRIAQSQATARLVAKAPTGYAVTHDIGDQAGGIHPHNKTEVGRRLAMAIRRQVFHRTDSQIAPPHTVANQARLDTTVTTGSSVGVSFVPAPMLLRWGKTQNCSVCCAESTRIVQMCTVSNCTAPGATWVNVSATVTPTRELRVDTLLEGATQVRYAWSNFPQCVLFDQFGLPVGPFLLRIQ